MPDSISIKKFLNLCEQTLARAEIVVDSPKELENILAELDSILRTEWPEVIINLSEAIILDETKLQAEAIFAKIKKLELISNSRLNIYDGMDAFFQQSKNR
jgi:hypothetical protein